MGSETHQEFRTITKVGPFPTGRPNCVHRELWNANRASAGRNRPYIRMIILNLLELFGSVFVEQLDVEPIRNQTEYLSGTASRRLLSQSFFWIENANFWIERRWWKHWLWRHKWYGRVLHPHDL